jgi:hypothetical protein
MAKYPKTRQYGGKRNQKQRYTHRVVAEAELGRALEPHEVVHHLDWYRFNNHPYNLVILASQAEHARLENWNRRYNGLETLFEEHLPRFLEVKN